MEYKESIELITSKNNFYIDLGLNRISQALEKLGNPHNKLKYIHVAGTNGKGSVCAILASVLKEYGLNVGLYTSPHIWEYTERIKFNNIEIPQEKFAEYTEKIYSLGIHLTEFEILTIMAFLYFKEQCADIVILETGLGGKLDATNVIQENLCSVITHIDLDHTEILGNTKEEIAAEKAGIIKHNCPIITSMGFEAIRDKAEKENSLFMLISPFVNPKYTEALSLKGKHQEENLALALGALNYIFPEIKEQTLIYGLKKVQNPCRFEFRKDKNLVIDACHNPNGIQALKQNLDEYFPNEKRRYVFGCLNTKDYKKMISILFEEGDEIYFNEFNYPKACSYEELSSNCPIKSYKFKDCSILTKDKLNIICGSFYMLGQMKFLED